MLPIIQDVLQDMNLQLDRIDRSVRLLDDERLWTKPGPGMNSIGNLCLHLAGNEYQNFVTGLGGKPLVRERSQEFEAEGGLSGEELVAKLRAVRLDSTAVLSSLTEPDLDRDIVVPYGEEDWKRMKGGNEDAGAPQETKNTRLTIIKVATHYGYHAGQIVLLAKLLDGTGANLSGSYH